MATEDDPREAAIKRYNDPAARDRQIEIERQQMRDVEAQRQQKNAAAWPLAFNSIWAGISKTIDYFASRSPFVISQIPTADSNTVSFEIKPSGQPEKREALFRFVMDGDGMVQKLMRVASLIGRTPCQLLTSPPTGLRRLPIRS